MVHAGDSKRDQMKISMGCIPSATPVPSRQSRPGLQSGTTWIFDRLHALKQVIGWAEDPFCHGSKYWRWTIPWHFVDSRPVAFGPRHSARDQVKGAKFSEEDIKALTHRIQFGGDEVVKAKDGAGSATLSMVRGRCGVGWILLFDCWSGPSPDILGICIFTVRARGLFKLPVAHS